MRTIQRRPPLHHHVYLLFLLFFIHTSSNSNKLHALAEQFPPTTTTTTTELLQTVLQDSILRPIRTNYESLPPKGKFATCAVTGFGLSKCTVHGVVRVAKYTAAAFLVSEVADQVGLLDTFELEDGQREVMGRLKDSVCRNIRYCKSQIRETVNLQAVRDTFQSNLEKDRMGTLGFTTGAIAGLVW